MKRSPLIQAIESIEKSLKSLSLKSLFGKKSSNSNSPIVVVVNSPELKKPSSTSRILREITPNMLNQRPKSKTSDELSDYEDEKYFGPFVETEYTTSISEGIDRKAETEFTITDDGDHPELVAYLKKQKKSVLKMGSTNNSFTQTDENEYSDENSLSDNLKTPSTPL